MESTGMPAHVLVRKATEADVEGIAAVLALVAAERIHSAIDQPFTLEEHRTYLRTRSPREGIFVACSADRIVGFQSLDLWASTIHSMRHVGQLGTFVIPERRAQGLGNALFERTKAFAINVNYRKFVIQVRASNLPAQRFYRRLGFEDCGLLRDQVWIDGNFDGEVIMELFL